MRILDDPTSFGISHFNLAAARYVTTAVKIQEDKSTSMRSIRYSEHAPKAVIANTRHAMTATARKLSVMLPDEGEVHVTFNISTITDNMAEKQQNVDEVAAVLMESWEDRAKRYGEDEKATRGERLCRSPLRSTAPY